MNSKLAISVVGLLGLTILFAGVGPLPAQAPPPPPHHEDKIGQLERRIANLEMKVRELDKVIEALSLKLDPKKTSGVVKDTECANNLSQLWKMETVYMRQFGGRMKMMPTAGGSDFWLALTKTTPPMIEATSDMLVCPSSGQKPRPGYTSYRGPTPNVATLKDSDPVGCCEPGSHANGKINVLLKSAEVVMVGPDDPIYERAMITTAVIASPKLPDGPRDNSDELGMLEREGYAKCEEGLGCIQRGESTTDVSQLKAELERGTNLLFQGMALLDQVNQKSNGMKKPDTLRYGQALKLARLRLLELLNGNTK